MNDAMPTTARAYVAARNTCKMCAPLGAALVFLGAEGCVPLIHGSQGCATYIRRYLISHFREPVDIASSNFSEAASVFGGDENLCTALDNIIRQYAPAAVGVATTCLTETMGEDTAGTVDRSVKRASGRELPVIFHAATPSYRGNQMNGFHEAVRAVVTRLAAGGPRRNRINLFSGMISCADIRCLHATADASGLDHTLFPDYADTLDGPAWDAVKRMNAGGTPLSDIALMGVSVSSIVLGDPASASARTAHELERAFNVKFLRCEYPIGVGNADRFHDLLEECSGRSRPERFTAERGRLIDAYFDAHKYLAGVRVAIAAEEDLAVALASFLDEAGMRVVAIASGGTSAGLTARVAAAVTNSSVTPVVWQDADYETLTERVRGLDPDLLVGNSKAAAAAEDLAVPLVRCGFPVHDRFGGQRLRLFGYGGTQELLDRIVNELLVRKQAAAGRRFSYL